MTVAEELTAEEGTIDTGRRPRPRRIVRILLVAAVGFGLIGAGGYLWLSASSGVGNLGVADCADVAVTAPQGVSSEDIGRDQHGVCMVIASLGDAWENHDAEAYGGLFTEGGTYTTWVGTHYTGRQDIIDGHQALFEGVLAGTRLADAFLAIEFVHADVAVVTTRGDTYEGDRPDELTKLQTYTVVREDDAWRVASFHNTKRQPVMERVQFLMNPGSRPAAEG